MSEALKPWYAVAIPHEDIREGRLAEAIFAANLWAVVSGYGVRGVPRSRRVLPEDLPDDRPLQPLA